jgi:hypothetical protein
VTDWDSMEGPAMPEKLLALESQSWVALPEFAWEQISEPGTYMEKETGDLYRIPKEALVIGSSPIIRKTSLGGSRFVQVSKNPFITTLEARMLCAEHNIHPSF